MFGCFGMFQIVFCFSRLFGPFPFVSGCSGCSWAVDVALGSRSLKKKRSGSSRCSMCVIWFRDVSVSFRLDCVV